MIDSYNITNVAEVIELEPFLLITVVEGRGGEGRGGGLNHGVSSYMALRPMHNGRNRCQQLPTLLGLVGQQCCVRLYGPKSLTGFKLYATSANIVVVPCKRTQQVATLLGPTILGVVGQQCWVRLHGPLYQG